MRVLLGDDQMRVRSALRLLLEQEPGFQVVGEAADATGLLVAATEKAPDLVLLDWELPGLPAAQLLRLLRYERPLLKIIAVSSRPGVARPALDIELIIEGERPLPPETQIALYRIAQESLNNINKHASASQVTITVDFLSEIVRLTIQDNGRGFNQADTPPQSLGLSIMQERAQKIGADLTINSQIGEGTIVKVECPIANGRE